MAEDDDRIPDEASTDDPGGGATRLVTSTLVLHAALGSLLWFVPGVLLLASGHPGGRLNPETAIVIATVGAGLLAVLPALAAVVAHRLAKQDAVHGRRVLPALGLGFVGPAAYGLAGSASWALASLLVARDVSDVALLGPAIAGGLAAPLVAVVAGAVYVFLRETGGSPGPPGAGVEQHDLVGG